MYCSALTSSSPDIMEVSSCRLKRREGMKKWVERESEREREREREERERGIKKT